MTAAAAAEIDPAVAAWPLAMKIAAKFARKLPHLRDELEGAAGLGLARARAAYDPGANRGVPFGAYAATRIKGAIIDMLRCESPRGFRRASRRAGTYAGPVRVSFIGQDTESRDMADWAAARGLRPGIAGLLDADSRPDARLEAIESDEAFRALLRHATTRQAEVLALCYRDGLDDVEAGRRLGLSHNTVRYHRGLGLALIRAALESRRATA